ncbi:MAG TPA: CerR family C-terminal domain-containing protein [Sedimentisphaerales bacterium]|nr:CerR family C-terminal domain-containing protein [Sedimentisphaerales bacterium]
MAISAQKEGNSGSADKPVQDRLLDAAEQLFSEHGFEGTSVRDIAAIAGCNIAAVNYYFGGKDKLYTEVWRRHLLQMRDARLQAIEQVMSESGGKPPLEDLLRSFANAFVGPFRDESRSRRFMNLMAREMIDQRVSVNLFVDEVVKPTMGAVRGALLRACPGLEESRIPLLIVFLAGQLMHVVHIKAMFDKAEVVEMPAFDLNEAVDHIVKFSAAGIRAYADGKTQ